MVKWGRCNQQLIDLSNVIVGKRPKYHKRQYKLIFLDDNAPSHHGKPARHDIITWSKLPHAVYLLDLASSNCLILINGSHTNWSAHTKMWKMGRLLVFPWKEENCFEWHPKIAQVEKNVYMARSNILYKNFCSNKV